MATDDAMDVESATQSLCGMDVEQLPPPAPPGTASTATAQSSVSDSAPEPPISPQVAESIVVARQGVHAFLRDRKADDIVPDNSRVVIIDGGVRLRLAFRALSENGVRAAPVVDTSTYQFCGMLSTSDIIDSLLHLYFLHPPEETQLNISERLNDYTVHTWLQQKQQAQPPSINSSPLVPQPFRYAEAEGSLLDAVRIMRDARLLHLPILSRDRTLLHTLEHWRVLRFLHRHFASPAPPPAGAANAPAADPAHTARLFSLTMSQLNLGTYSNLITVLASTPLLQCLQTMQQRMLSALPVVDGQNQLIEVYSTADTAHLAGGVCDGNMLQRPVGEVLRGIRRGAPFVGITCQRGEMLGTVFERFERTGVQRLYIIGESGLEGVVTLSDLLQYFLHGY